MPFCSLIQIRRNGVRLGDHPSVPVWPQADCGRGATLGGLRFRLELLGLAALRSESSEGDLLRAGMANLRHTVRRRGGLTVSSRRHVMLCRDCSRVSHEGTEELSAVF